MEYTHLIRSHSQRFHNIIVMLFASLLLAISAQITIPALPVPVTLQTLAVLWIGENFGYRRGCQIVLAYLLEGMCGLPVFANFSGGAQVLLGPTGGYLLGFLPTVLLVGYFFQIHKIKNPLIIFLTALFGITTLYLLGYLWLAQFIGFHNAYELGVQPFYLIALSKLVVFTII